MSFSPTKVTPSPFSRSNFYVSNLRKAIASIFPLSCPREATHRETRNEEIAAMMGSPVLKREGRGRGSQKTAAVLIIC